MSLFVDPQRGVTPLGGVAMPLQQNNPTLFEILTREERPRSMAVLLLILVMLLHLWLGLWLLKPTEPPTEIKPLKVMEVALLASHTENPSPPLPPPPKPIPPQKPPVKKVAKKKIPVIKKVVELPKPEPVSEEMPSSLPSDLPVKPSTSEAKPVTTAVNKASTERTNAKTVVSGVVPLIRVQPKYPSRAVNRHIEGWVKIEFTISTSGTVTDAAVVAAEPAEIFDYEALKALKKWKFKEKIVNGVAVEQRAIQTLQFKLTQ